MEEFLGILFCGGRGTRIGNLTGYTSKSFIPVYNKPVFKFGLELLEKSKLINEIVLLTNDENDFKLSKLGYKTIIQDDNKVFDMISGWEYVKQITKTKKNGVLVPSDNICEVNIDSLVKEFIKNNSSFLFSIKRLNDAKKLSEMGSFDKEKKKFTYKNTRPETKFGVIAPYIIRNNLNCNPGENIFENENSFIAEHKGYWFDLGDYESIYKAARWHRKNKANGF